jgi:hypothetical protein
LAIASNRGVYDEILKWIAATSPSGGSQTLAVMRKRQAPEGQASLFDRPTPHKVSPQPVKPRLDASRKWRMPERDGRTVAEIRVRWTKRLTPAQVARVEAELAALPRELSKLGFGAVQVERVFVRRRRT